MPPRMMRELDDNVFPLEVPAINEVQHPPFDIKTIAQSYEQSRSGREWGKWLFSICTLGLGAIYLWATTTIVKQGEIGLRRDFRGKMILLPPGRHSNFPWENYPCEPKSLAQERIELGPFTIFTVPTGSVGITQNKGMLSYFQEGQHLLTEATHIFLRLFSMKQETRRLDAVKGYTKDPVAIILHADVRYEVENPALAFPKIHDIDQSIQEIAKICIQQVIAEHHIMDFNISSLTNVEQAEMKEEHGLGQVNQELTSKISEQLKKLGIKLLSIGITDRSIVDTQLAHELGAGAVTQAQTNSKSLAAKQAADQQLVAAKAQAASIEIIAQADATATKTRGDAIVKVSELLKDNPAAFEMYRQSQITEMLRGTKNPNLFFSQAIAGTIQTPFPQMPLSLGSNTL